MRFSFLPVAGGTLLTFTNTMKHQILTITAILFAGGLLAADPPSPRPPEEGFESLAEIERWASSHEWTGGSAQEVVLEGNVVYYSKRSFTSGLPTTELILYVTDKNSGRIKPFLIIPTQGKEMRVRVEDKKLKIDTFSRTEKKWVEMISFGESALPNIT